MQNLDSQHGLFSAEIQTRSLHHVVYAAVVDAIHKGELDPGDRVSEVDIARKLGISRSPVREAFARLAHDGLVEQRPRRGTFVTEFSRDDIAEIREVRALIEGYASRIACHNLEKCHEQELQQLIAAMVNSADECDWIRTASLNARFHESVVELAGKKTLNRVWGALDPLAWLVAATVPRDHAHDPEDLQERHERLVAALRTGDPDVAEDAFRGHILSPRQG